ncbi:hypothetical protein BH10ACT11_BH10ACT11_01170 [soil metagenome]
MGDEISDEARGRLRSRGSRLGVADWRIASALGVLVVAALALRIPYFTDALLGDELSTYVVVHGNSLGRMMQLIHSDQEVTPPLYFLLASLTQHLGDSSDWLRAAPMLSGLAAIPLTYALGRRTVGRPAALVGAALVALSPFLIYYSTEARNYALSMGICLGSTLAMVRAIDEEKRGWWVLYAVLSAAAMYTHYTNVFLLAAQAGWALIARPAARRPLLLANAGAALLFLPWLPGYLEDQRSPGADVIGTLSPFSFAGVHVDLFRLLVGTPYDTIRHIPGDLGLAAIALGVVIGACAGVSRARHARRWVLDSNTVLIVVLACSTVAGAIVYSALSVDVYAARNMINVWPGWALLLGTVLTSGRRWPALAASILVVAGFAIGAVKSLDSNQQRPDYDAAARYLTSVSSARDAIVDAPAAAPGAKESLEVALADLGDGDEPILRVGIATLADSEAIRAPGGPGQFVKPPPPIPSGQEIAKQALAEAPDGNIFLVTGGSLDFDTLLSYVRGLHVPLAGFLDALPASYRPLSVHHFPGLLGGASVYELGKDPAG